MQIIYFSLALTLLCHGAHSNSMGGDGKTPVDQSSDVKPCTDAKECPISDICRICDEGYGPECQIPTCINGKCGVIEQCSQELSSTTVSTTEKTTVVPNKCTPDDLSQCVVPQVCARCLQGYTPGCYEATCVDGLCQTIAPCSRKSESESNSLTTIIFNEPQCKQDSECPYPEYCATECPTGTGPLCASAICVEQQCQIVSPCSKKKQCTVDDLSQCVVPAVCADCKPGYSPECAQASCENGQCKTIQPCSIFKLEPTPSTTTDLPQCKNDGDCSFVKQCVPECKPGFQPTCATGACVNGRCVITPPCSQKAECTENDVSQCSVRIKCAKCVAGYSPGCTEVLCENGKCKIIEPCSIFTPPETTTPSSTTLFDSHCRKDGDCITKGICFNECKPGYGPLCTVDKCVDGQCIVIAPCSQRIECTPKNLSSCPIPKICAICKEGTGPGCAEARCVEGQCEVIMPCSIQNPVTKTTTPKTKPNVCTKRSQCPVRRICVPRCPPNKGPLCSTAECINGQCNVISPCTRQTCKTAKTCPANTKNRPKCPKGYGPPCEQAACKCGLCSIIEPCSKKIQPESECDESDDSDE